MKPRHAAALALVVWSLLSLPLSWAESHTEALKTFTAPDGAFTFSYSKQLVRCEKDPHGNDVWHPPDICSSYQGVCDGLAAVDEKTQTSVVCFAYPRNKFTDTRAFEAATFSVEVVHDSKTANDCLAGPQLKDPDGGGLDVDKNGTKRIHGVSFAAFNFGAGAMNQGTSVNLYRTFHNGKCYQLGIDQGSAAAQIFDPPVGEPDCGEVERTLDQALNSFRFLN